MFASTPILSLVAGVLGIMSISLKVNGFVLNLEPVPVSKDYFRGIVSLKSVILGEDHTLHTDAIFPLKDLKRLSEWINEHLHALLEHPNTMSRTWVPLDLTMEIQLQGGEIYYEDGVVVGDFSVLVMLNIGFDSLTKTRVYSGFASTVNVEAINEFRACLLNYISSNTSSE